MKKRIKPQVHHIASILYSKFHKISRSFVYFYNLCKLCRFLCQHHYVNCSNYVIYSIYHFQLFCKILRSLAPSNTKYSFCKFSCILPIVGKFGLPTIGDLFNLTRTKFFRSRFPAFTLSCADKSSRETAG